MHVLVEAAPHYQIWHRWTPDGCVDSRKYGSICLPWQKSAQISDRSPWLSLLQPSASAAALQTADLSCLLIENVTVQCGFQWTASRPHLHPALDVCISLRQAEFSIATYRILANQSKQRHCTVLFSKNFLYENFPQNCV